jgi:mannose-1-phosphate guanylyltransferase
MPTEPERLYRASATPAGHGTDWTIALAGGNAMRLADYVQQRFGQRMPKQYCRLLGHRSLLEHTLDRMNDSTPPARTLTVIGSDHEMWATEQLRGRSDHVFRQPSSREIGTALYVAFAMLQRWSPDAVVTVTPTEHDVAPAGRNVAEIDRARELAGAHRDKVVLVGARPDEVDPELGYISLGATLAGTSASRVSGFLEKPNTARAAELVSEGALWNTMVCCGTVRAFWELGRAGSPALIDLLENLVPLIDTDDEDAALAAVYSLAPVTGFARELLERSPERLLVTPLEGVEWSDRRRAERNHATLARRPARAAKPMYRLPIATAS